MVKVNITNIQTNKSFDLTSCIENGKGINILNNVTSYSFTPTHNTFSVNNYAFANVDDVFDGEELSFKSLSRSFGSNEEWKSFIRLRNAEFKIEVIRPEKTRYCFAKFAGDTTTQKSSSKFEDYEFKMLRQSHWLSNKYLEFNYDDLVVESDGGYNDSEHTGAVENGYTYTLQYGNTNNSISSAYLPLGDVKGDAKAYIDIRILQIGDANDIGIGLNNKWDNDSVTMAYRPKYITLDIDDTISIQSYPINPYIKVDDGTNIINAEQYTEELKYPYFSVEPNTINDLVFTNIRKATVYVIEQYYNL
ncbi:MAG: hypothetical protein ACK5HS_04505 [Mycoplasmatales bacterium]